MQTLGIILIVFVSLAVGMTAVGIIKSLHLSTKTSLKKRILWKAKKFDLLRIVLIQKMQMACGDIWRRLGRQATKQECMRNMSSVASM